jgi:hypothetical protein
LRVPNLFGPKMRRKRHSTKHFFSLASNEQRKAMAGRIADGESNLEYGKPQGVAKESDECDGAGCFKVSCEGGADCEGEGAMPVDR